MPQYSSAPVDTLPASPPDAGGGPLNRAFRLRERGSTVPREIRGGLATFFTMAYILVLNPIILGGAADKYGHHLSQPQLITATALVAAVMTVIMGVVGNVPLAVAAGLGLNGVVAFQLAPRMSWPDAMGLVVLEGLLICLLVVTGFRRAIMEAIPTPLKKAVSVGIGLFIAFLGLVDSGFATRMPDAAHSTVPVQLGSGGTLLGWPIVVFAFGVLLTVALLARRVKGAILIGIVASTVLAVIVDKVAHVPAKAWGLTVPAVPHGITALPDFGLIGRFSLFGAFSSVGAVTAVLFIFTLVLSDFFDAMGTIIGVGSEAGLVDDKGSMKRLTPILFVDGLAAAAGGAASGSSNTCFVESAAGVGEGARTGLANIVTGLLFALALFFTPVLTMVPQQAAAPALVVVGFLLMTQVKDIPWGNVEIAIPAFLTIAVMPFTYSITNGIGAGFISYALIKTVVGKFREVHWLLWVVTLFFLAYFAIDPVQRLLGVK